MNEALEDELASPELRRRLETIAWNIIRRDRVQVDVEDLVAAGLAAWWRSSGDYAKRDGGSRVGFLSQRARWAMLDELRRTDPLTRGARAGGEERAETPMTDAEVGLHDGGRGWVEKVAPASEGETATALREEWEHATRRLDPREAEMVRMRAEGRTFDEIGRWAGLTLSRVCQLFDEIAEVVRTGHVSRKQWNKARGMRLAWKQRREARRTEVTMGEIDDVVAKLVETRRRLQERLASLARQGEGVQKELKQVERALRALRPVVDAESMVPAARQEAAPASCEATRAAMADAIERDVRSKPSGMSRADVMLKDLRAGAFPDATPQEVRATLRDPRFVVGERGWTRVRRDGQAAAEESVGKIA